MQLLTPDDPLLTEVCQGVDFQNPPFDLIEFSKELVKFMIEKDGIGLAANQVGIPYRIFAMRGTPQHFVCFNPRIVQPSEQEIILEEGCLTYPGLYVKIKRPQHVRVRWQQPNGETRTDTFTGLTARIIQHEMDHLDGLIFYTKATRYHRDKAFKDWKLWKKRHAKPVPA